MTHLAQLFERLNDFNIIVNQNKCALDVTQLEFLGYMMNSQGSSPVPEKLQSIVMCPAPSTWSAKALSRYA